MVSRELEEVFSKWAESAWATTEGDWDKAKAAFLGISSRELPNLDPDDAEEIKAEVWRFFANARIAFVVEKLRAQARSNAPVPQTRETSEEEKEPKRYFSRRMAEASMANDHIRIGPFMERAARSAPGWEAKLLEQLRIVEMLAKEREKEEGEKEPTAQGSAGAYGCGAE